MLPCFPSQPAQIYLEKKCMCDYNKLLINYYNEINSDLQYIISHELSVW